MDEIKAEDEKKKQPIYIDKLELGEGEQYVGGLSNEDKFQLIARWNGRLQVILSQMALLLNSMCLIQYEIAKKQGIDIEEVLDGKSKKEDK